MPKHVHITAPRGFSKSTNLDMLHYFFEHELDENFTAKNPETSKKLEIFKNTKFFKNNSTLFWSHFAKYPVIKLDFSPLTTKNYTEFQSTFYTHCVRPLLEKFSYLANSTKIVNPEYKNEIKMMYSPEYPWGEGAMITFGDLLSTYLSNHHGVKPILLIDEIDAPIRSVLFEQHTPIDGECIFQFCIVFVDDIIKQEDITRALLTGRGRVAAPYLNYGRGALYSEVTITHSSIFDTKELYGAYGLTKKDVESFKHDFQLSDPAMENIESRHEGYCVYDDKMIFEAKGDKAQTVRQEKPVAKIFNTYSILQRLHAGVEDDWWIYTAGLQDLEMFFSHRTRLSDKVKECILTNCSFIAKEQLEYVELLNFRTAINSRNFSSIDENVFLQFCVESGYFTVLKKFQGKFWIAPPNAEIRERLEAEILLLPKKGVTR